MLRLSRLTSGIPVSALLLGWTSGPFDLLGSGCPDPSEILGVVKPSVVSDLCSWIMLNAESHTA